MKQEDEFDDEEIEYDEAEDENILEIILDNKSIDELIEKLQNLKKDKNNFQFRIDEEATILIHHDEDSTLEEE